MLPQMAFCNIQDCTSLTWDNYDERTETLSGAGTLHDTVGICYQNETDLSPATNALANDSVDSSELRIPAQIIPEIYKSRRSLKLQPILEPYRKKPRITVFKYTVTDIPWPPKLTTVERRDLFWMINVATSPETPMWVGWNSQMTDDPLPKQKIAYMENLTLPITRLDVVAETLRVTQQVAQECGQEYGVVHYDLNAAKPALQIQSTEAPKYDNLFICFGPFHIVMSYFGSVEYLIDSSGGPEILVDADVLASGSLTGFLKWKHFNRCKILHLLFATALQVLHFKNFLEEFGPISQELATRMDELKRSPGPAMLECIEGSQEYKYLMESYEHSVQQTLDGEHGNTARFWMTYITLVKAYLMLSRACRTNDVDLFVYALSQMCPVFFAASHQNYARWMVRYCLRLLNIDNTHPGLRDLLQAGAFSVRRTSTSFSRTPVDMTLEQTVNADAASRLTGVSSFTNSDSARKRWMITRAVRSSIVENLMASAGLKQTPDASKKLETHRIKKDNEDIHKIMHGITNTMNPFKLPATDNLYCLSTGKKVSVEVRDDLVNCVAIGRTWCDEFKEECLRDEDRFQKPIPRRKLKTFTSDAVKSKVKSHDKLKVMELTGSRDLLGRLLYLSAMSDLDLQKVFEYPLMPVPLSLANIDGAMHNPFKSKLARKIEDSVYRSTGPEDINVVMVDAIFFFRTQTEGHSTYGEVARCLLSKLVQMAPLVQLICDTYIHPSIKDPERMKRGDSSETVYSITGPNQNVPRDWQKALDSSSFKESFLRFLSTEWQRQEYGAILGQRQINLALDHKCFRYTVRSGVIVREQVLALNSEHEEADTLIIYHLHKLTQ